jgi:SAM-dependent methyltransferase
MLEDHLGGHNNITHVDRGALQWAIDQFGVQSMLDVGCGPGGMVELAESMGLNACGIDGDHTVDRYNNSKFVIHDFTKGPAPINRSYDLCWSVEFVEHVYEQYVPNFAKNMAQCRWMIMSHARPGQTGHHHVNCQPSEYWIESMKDYGFKYDPDLTKDMRKASTAQKKFVKKSGLVFING